MQARPKQTFTMNPFFDRPTPVSIDQAMEDCPFKSASSLMQLGTDVIEIIMLFVVDAKDLKNLALVNSDCRQLARSRQFASVVFDYSPRSMNITSLLWREKALRNSNSTPKGNAMGPCIRRIKVLTDEKWLEHYHNIPPTNKFRRDWDARRNMRDKRLEVSHAVRSTYTKLICSLISNRVVLPNIDVLEWSGSAYSLDTWHQLPISFIRYLITSNLQHLKLVNVRIDPVVSSIQTPRTTRWNLKTLSLNYIEGPRKPHDRISNFHGTLTVCTYLISSCSHSLRLLHWFNSDDDRTVKYANIPSFPELCMLKLDGTEFTHSNIVGKLLSSNLLALDLSSCQDVSIKTVLRTNSTRLLTELSIHLSGGPRQDTFEILDANRKSLTKLAISSETIHGEGNWEHDIYLETRILPTLAIHFRLTSLFLRWSQHANRITNSILQILSKMRTLEQLCIGIGDVFRENWKPNNQHIARHLSKLPQLKGLAFREDAYPYYHAARSAHYYPVDEDFARKPSHWEEAHKKRMAGEVGNFALAIPSLEWMYLGQLAMTIQRKMVKRGTKWSKTLPSAIVITPISQDRNDVVGREFRDRMFARNDFY